MNQIKADKNLKTHKFYEDPDTYSTECGVCGWQYDWIKAVLLQIPTCAEYLMNQVLK